MMDIVVRRGLALADRAASSDDLNIELPGWGIALLIATVLVFFVVMCVAEYTLRALIPTLAMVETPSAVITVTAPKASASGEEKEGLLETAPEATLVHLKPITSSIRATLKHLRSVHGRMAYLKGLGYGILHGVALAWTQDVIRGFIRVFFPNFVASLVATALAGAICAPLHAAWTSKVISEHTDITFWQRVPSRSFWKVLALPAAIYALFPHVLFGVLHAMSCMVNIHPGTQPSFMVLAAYIGMFFVAVASVLFVYVPILATLVRIEASLLSDDLDTIVPFDRTFAGKVVPLSLGGTGAIRFVDAWKSFDREARRRVIKLFVKFVGILILMNIVFFHTVILELFLILGSSFGPAMRKAVENARR